MGKRLTVIKRDEKGEEVFRWEGVELSRKDHEVQLEARFNVKEHRLGEIVLREGDRLLETYSSRRWYNVFEVYDGGSGRLKGWYCNVSYPAEIGEETISFRDLALDLIVHPDGRQELLDEDQFEALELDEADRRAALDGWEELQEHFRRMHTK